MKYTHKTKRIIAIILIMITCIVNAFSYTVYANEINDRVICNDLVDINDESIALTSLLPNTAQDWAIAYKDGIGYPGFFHSEVEKNIKNNNIGFEYESLQIPGAGRYGFNGRADIVKMTDNVIYIWDVKPASNGYFPKKKDAIKQVQRYVDANMVRHKIGPNNVILDNTFEVTIPISGITYEVEYCNSIYNTGLIFYRFVRLGKQQEEKEPVTQSVPSTSKEGAVSGIVDDGKDESDEVIDNTGVLVDWKKLGQFVAIASAFVAVGYVANSSSVQETLVSTSITFLTKLGNILRKGSGLGLASIGIFANANTVLAAENNSDNIDLQAVNDVLYDYETALEVLLGYDYIDELLDAIKGGDQAEIENMVKAIQEENDEYDEAGEAQPPRDPLIIDFGESGIDLCSLKDGVNFDLDNNGYAEKTAWIGTTDGFLAIDRNNNGIIDNGGELFGDQVDLGEGKLSSSGFEALAILDDNKDNIIDKNDNSYTELLIWIDSNHNGYSEANEIELLEYYEIKEIQLSHTEGSVVDDSTGTMMTEFSKVIYKNDIETTISEFWFPINSSDTTHGDTITAGNVPSIEQALEDDTTGQLQELINGFIESDSIAWKRYYVRKIIFFITDSDDIAISSRGGNIDARELHAIEKFMGREFNGVGGSDPNTNAADILKNIYKNIENYYYSILSLYGEFGAYKLLMFEYEDENGEVRIDVTALVHKFNSLIEQGEDIGMLIYDLGIYLKCYDKIHNTEYFNDYYNYYNGMSDVITDSVNASASSNLYIGTNNEDSYSGTSSKNYIFGEGGDDSLYGGEDNDYIVGLFDDDSYDSGAGNDIMEDCAGNDTYVFAKGYGKDTIIDNGGSNKIIFKNLTSEDILVNGTGDYDVTIKIKNTNDLLIIKNFCEDEILKDYTLEFKDKTLHCADKDSPFRHIYGDDSDNVLKAVIDGSIMHAFNGNDTVIGSDSEDIIYGNSGNDNIKASEGNDIIYGGNDDDYICGESGDDVMWGELGNDTLDGSSGNDHLFGGAGDDIYIFDENYGRDIIEDTDGISIVKVNEKYSAEELSFYSVANDVIIAIDDTDDVMIISSYNIASKNYYIEIGDNRLSIDDLLIEYNDTVLNDMELTVGTDDSDAIFVNDVKNIIVSGKEYDYIVGGIDDDIVFAGEDTDRILTGLGNDIIYSGNGNNQVYGDENDDYLITGDNNDYINGGTGDDIIIANSGDDFIDGSSGNDIYYVNAGDGNDSIMDSDGNNVIIFGEGISSDGITAYRHNWNDLLIKFEGVSNVLIIKNYCIDEAARNFELIFSDGAVYAATDKESALRNIKDNSGTEYMPSVYSDGVILVSTDGDDQLAGSEEADTLIGGNGNNRLTGNAGNDCLDGGAGKDYLFGGLGSDTYIYQSGYGTDIFSDSQGTNYIEITGYTISEVEVYRTNWNDITLVFDGTGENGLNDDFADKIVIEGFFTSENNRKYYLSFNGSRYYATDDNSPLRIIKGTSDSDYMQGFDNKEITMYGGEGIDTLNGGNSKDYLYGGNGDDRLLGFLGNDTLKGDEGNDYMEGGADDDTYIFNVGSGIDTINDNQGINIISLGEGINKDAIVAYRTNWNDLTITFTGIEDKIVLQGYFITPESRRFDLVFFDGNRFEYSNIDSPINQVCASENDDWMSSWSDEGISLDGRGGNDNLTGGAGNDVLRGGTGNDTIAGGMGDDIYKYKLGDGFDTIIDSIGINKIIFEDVASSNVTYAFDLNNDTINVVITLIETGDSIVINEYNEGNYIFEFSDGIYGSVTILDGIATFIQTNGE